MIGLKELKRAVKRNPQKVLTETRNFLSRGIATYKQGIIRKPWEVGSSGGGAPVATGNLRDTHMTKISGLQATIGPNTSAVRYAEFIHKGTSRMKERPWLDHVKKTKEGAIRDLYLKMLKNITTDLAK